MSGPETSGGIFLEWMKVLVIPLTVAGLAFWTDIWTNDQQVDAVFASLAVDIVITGVDVADEDKTASQDAWEDWAFAVLQDSPHPPTEDLEKLFGAGDLESPFDFSKIQLLPCNLDTDFDGENDRITSVLPGRSPSSLCIRNDA